MILLLTGTMYRGGSECGSEEVPANLPDKRQTAIEAREHCRLFEGFHGCYQEYVRVSFLFTKKLTPSTEIVPSSARSTSSVATPLPPQFGPLLSETVEHVKSVIARVMPVEKPLTALEEAMFEDDDGEEGALEREMLSQCALSVYLYGEPLLMSVIAMQTLRIHRPRVIIHGAVGMGQGYIGAAALHHLEGYHIQSLELGTLMSDSTRVSPRMNSWVE